MRGVIKRRSLTAAGAQRSPVVRFLRTHMPPITARAPVNRLGLQITQAYYVFVRSDLQQSLMSVADRILF